MTKKIKFLSCMIVLFCLLITNLALAEDYTPPPGVLGPDEVDFGGATVNFVAEWEAYWDWEDYRLERLEKAKELFNMNFEFSADISQEMLMSRLMAGESTNDIWVWRFQHTMAVEGAYYPVGQILPAEYYEQLPLGDRLAKENFTKYLGQQYSFGTGSGEFPRTLFGMPYNKTMLQEAGLPDISELYRQGEWTWDKMESIAEAITADTDGDGEIDRWAMASPHWLPIEWFIMHSNGVPYIKMDDGKFVFTWNTEEALRTMNRMADWYDKGWINTDMAWNDIRVGRKLAMAWGEYRIGNYGLEGEEDDEIGWVPFPKGPDVEEHQVPALGVKFPVLPSNVQDPEALIAVYEYLVRPTDKLEAEMLPANFPNRDAYQNYLKAVEDWTGFITPEFRMSVPGVSAPRLREILTGEKSAASEMDAIAPEIQAILNDVFDQ